MAGRVLAAGLPPLLPTPTTSCVSLRPPPASYVSRRFEDRKPAGRADLSDSWITDKDTGAGLSSSDRNWRKMPGRASVSPSWVEDKKHGPAGTWNSSIERSGRPMCSWIGGKRPASREPSSDRDEKKAKPVEKEAAPATGIVVEPEEMLYAGPSFARSPDPSELPLPWLLILPRYACMTD